MSSYSSIIQSSPVAGMSWRQAGRHGEGTDITNNKNNNNAKYHSCTVNITIAFQKAKLSDGFIKLQVIHHSRKNQLYVLEITASRNKHNDNYSSSYIKMKK